MSMHQKFNSFRRALAATTLGFMLAAGAQADIGDYNARLQVNDFAGAVLEARQIWEGWSPQTPDGYVIAREFAYTGLRGGDAAFVVLVTGRALAELEGLTLEQSQLLQLLNARARFMNGERKAGEDVVDMLEAMSQNAEPPSVIAIDIANQHTTDMFAQEKWKEAARTSDAIKQMWRSAGDAYLRQWLSASIASNVSGFMRDPDNRYYYSLHDDYTDFTARWTALGEDMADDEQLKQSAFSAQAWLMTLEAARNGARRFKARPFPETPNRKSTESMSEDAPPFCDGTFDKTKNPKYPKEARRNWLVGSMLLSISLDEHGAVKDVEVLAAAPDDDLFTTPTIEAVETWSWDPKREAVEAGCTLERDNIILPVQFMIQ